jgi:hypothetical protein
MTNDWDSSVPERKALTRQIEMVVGSQKCIRLVHQALKNAGFKIENEEDRPNLIPWYYQMAGDISKAQNSGTTTMRGR